MSHEIAKLLLEHAATFLERTEAIKTAISLGMPIAEIEQYLDWLDVVRRGKNQPPPTNPPSSEKSTG
jgi:hypothetical protein